MELWISMGVVVAMLGGALWGVAVLSRRAKVKKGEKAPKRRKNPALTAASVASRQDGGRRRR